MKYIELFKNGFDSTIVEKAKPENWPYVGYSPSEGLMLTEILKEEEIDPTAGFVDLGLSVMWASCDVGTTNPEGEGIKYPWGELSWETIPLEFDPVYMNSDMELKWKEALQPRTPSPTQVKELLDNTTATEEVLNGVSGVRYTASNGNSIFVSNAERWTNAMKYLKNPWSTLEAACWKPDEGIIDNTCSGNPSFALYTLKTYQYPFRGVCNYLPQGGAILLEHGQTVAVSAQSDQLYCFPKTWAGTEFTAPTTGVVALTVSMVVDFSSLVKTYELDQVNDSRTLQLSSKEISVLASYATSDYIYVRLTSEMPTTLAINGWVVSSCADKSTLLRANKEQSINAKAYLDIYRLRYEDFSGYPITITWTGNSTLQMYLAEDCNFELYNEADNYLINPRPLISRKGTLTIDAVTVDSWADRIGEDGFMYVNFNPSNNGRVTFQTEKPS